MKKLFYTLVAIVLFLQAGYTQNIIKPNLIIPVNCSGFNFIRPEKINTPSFFALKLLIPAQPENNSCSLVYDHLLNKLSDLAFKKTTSLRAEFSFNDMLENTINRIDAGLLKKYDEPITELFKDAPSLIKVKCIILL